MKKTTNKILLITLIIIVLLNVLAMVYYAKFCVKTVPNQENPTRITGDDVVECYGDTMPVVTSDSVE